MLQKRKREDSKHEKDSAHCLWLRYQGPCARTGERPLKARGGSWFSASKDMGTSGLELQGSGFLKLNEL